MEKNVYKFIPAALGMCILLTACGAPKEETGSQTEPQTAVTQEDASAQEELQIPTKEEVFAMRECALQGMSDGEKERLKENIKVANQAMEQAYFYDRLFERLEDPEDLYWNYIDKTGDIQIGWAEEAEGERTKVIGYNRFDGANFIALMAEMKESIQEEAFREDFDALIDNMQSAMDTHEAEYIEEIYKIVHDMDYFLLRYGPEDVGKYTKDTSTVGKYYGALRIYEGE